ncbi:hypothetical protein Cgig2_023850 [Carnegiea gigantea]|uniref:5'-nucleotidase domain-containing protein n=1 Tax=Carnegiea gigantea TaxID=171969 RepID=A0A9Q1K9H9_9CARY|nr:hypothetical protein Cgig2_023850 [Carnegiea gigantea]
MAAFRRLAPFRAFGVSAQKLSYSYSLAAEGLERSFRQYSSDQNQQRMEDVEIDKVEIIRREFNAARRSFLKIPDALKSMPKMNPEGIYVNKNLRLDKIEVYGFDYDYTLAHYNANLQALIYDLAKEHLVNELRYPESCLKFEYDHTFPIRGLYYDKSKGCLLKLDFFGSIEHDGCYYGRRKLSREEILEIYGTRHIGRDQARGLVSLMDFFCFSEVSYCFILLLVEWSGFVSNCSCISFVEVVLL